MKKKTELTFADFVKKDGYMSFKGKKVEICLEPCLNGCDVAVYDLNQNLLEPKKCTDLELEKLNLLQRVVETRVKALEFAEEFYQRHEA